MDDTFIKIDTLQRANSRIKASITTDVYDFLNVVDDDPDPTNNHHFYKNRILDGVPINLDEPFYGRITIGINDFVMDVKHFYIDNLL